MSKKQPGRKRGDARMRELGQHKVSFWLSPDEQALARRATCGATFVGSFARAAFLAWCREQPCVTVKELAEQARRELGER
jgi:hypothetical protein